MAIPFEQPIAGGGGGGGSVTTIGPFGSTPNSAGGVISGVTLTLEPADATHPGGLSTGTQSIAGDKTFSGAIAASNLSGTNTGDVTLTAVGAAPSANGATISGQAVTLQPADGTHPGLVTSGTQTIGGAKTFSGAISASNLSGTNTGDVTLTAVGSSPSANAASLSGQALTIQPADGTNPGVLTAGAQSIGGAKTFTGAISASNLSGTNTGNVTIASFGASPTANGATLSGQAITLQPADATHPGCVSLASSTALASSAMLRDSNANSQINSLSQGVTLGTVNSTPATLTVSSTQLQDYSGSSTSLKSVNLPDATTLVVGQTYVIRNSGTGGTNGDGALGYLVLKDNAATTLARVRSLETETVILEDNSTSAGVWSISPKPATTLRYVYPKTSNWSVVANAATGDDNGVFTNGGASGTVVFTLPSGSSTKTGTTYTFVVAVAQTLEVLANTSSTIALGASISSSAGNLQSSTIGSSVTITIIATNTWVATAFTGTWAVA